MRRLLLIVSRVVLGLVVAVIAIVCVMFAVHRMELRRLHALSQFPVQRYLTETSPYFVLTNGNVIDGTGSAEREGQSIVVRNGKIVWVGDSSSLPAQPGAKTIDQHGSTVIPGLVMMHEHLFTTSAGNQLVEQSISFPLLYLAAGVTTARTTGSIDAAADLRVKRKVDAGEQPGPELFLTAPYLEGTPAAYKQMPALASSDDATRAVAADLAHGFTSIKAYTHITADELVAAITEAHSKSAKVTGHLCSVTYTQAAAIGIDNLEHGLLTDTEFYSGKQQDKCPPFMPYLTEYRDKLDVHSPKVIAMMDTLIAHHIAITSTLAVIESEFGGEPPDWYTRHENNSLIWRSWLLAQLSKKRMRSHHWQPLFNKELEFELNFVERGGSLLAGADPTGDGSILAGYADLREIELLNKAGFSVPQAVRIATLNGATFLGIADRAGSIDIGKQADLVIVKGDLARDVANIRNVQVVYRVGKGFDSKKMLDDVQGVVGLRNE